MSLIKINYAQQMIHSQILVFIKLLVVAVFFLKIKCCDSHPPFIIDFCNALSLLFDAEGYEWMRSPLPKIPYHFWGEAHCANSRWIGELALLYEWKGFISIHLWQNDAPMQFGLNPYNVSHKWTNLINVAYNMWNYNKQMPPPPDSSL